MICGDLTQSPVNKLENFGGMSLISSVVDQFIRGFLCDNKVAVQQNYYY